MSMSAKELHEELMDEPHDERDTEKVQLILRALSLLAAVLSSQDDVVCELRSDAAFLKRIGHPEEAETMDNAAARITQDAQEIAALKGELEDERIRLAACGVVAMANTPESAAKMRQMKDKYRSASLSDVERAVDAEMALRAELASVKAELAAETAIVDRIWDQLGRPSYEELKGRSIYDLIDALKAELASVKALAEAMADAIQFSDMAILTVAKAAAEAYRAAHPKEGA